ncbi:MAG TPA: phosphoribosylformylglycinamidine synthase subunit PurS [Ignavibacteria bacterium]|nr:phosphoribosylformylglycinamidine synthase subunit PurS [Ignavibacteria bacterium]HMR41152.1 phosphoribosylformylglycinamidine synthase subunit PurS [Ignavibacteria bacterium]
MYISKINISLRKTILDPQGKAIEHSLKSLGFDPIVDTRIGKYIELKINAGSKQEAEKISEEACKKLLANPVMEDFTFEVTESGGKQ